MRREGVARSLERATLHLSPTASGSVKSGFAACLYSEERAQQRLRSLRFQKGDEVAVKFGTGWRKGTVLDVMFRAQLQGGLGTVAPYVVRLERGPRMLVSTDSEDFVRSARH